MSRLLAWVLAVGLCVAPRVSPAAAPEAAKPLLSDPEAQAKLDAGLERFYAEDFEGAASFFAQAYAIEPTGFLLYSWAQAERYNGRCPRAIELFERFLATDPPRQESQKAREKIIECGGVPPHPSEAAPPPPAVEKQPQPQPQPQPPGPPPPASRPPRVPFPGLLGLGLSLTTVGVGVGATGAVLAAAGTRIRSDATSAADQQSFLDARARGDQRTRTGWALVGTGGALVVAGAVVLVLRSVKARRTTAVAAGGSPWRWSF